MATCNICGNNTKIYLDDDKKAINLVVLDNFSYLYCSRCIRKDLFTRLNAKIHPIKTKEGLSSKDLIEFGEAELKRNTQFDTLI